MADHKKPLIRRATEGFCRWCSDNGPAARFERTVAQGVLAAVAAGVTTGEWGASVLTAVVMAVVAPIQAAMGKSEKGAGDVDC